MEKDYGTKKLLEPVIIEEIENGKLDGKEAVLDRKVTILCYILSTFYTSCNVVSTAASLKGLKVVSGKHILHWEVKRQWEIV